MTNIKRLFLLFAFALISAAALSQPAAPNQPEPTIIMVPVVITDPALESGCWAQFYSGRQFKGDVATLVGPAEFLSLDKGTARQLKREIDSLVLGPKGTLTVYEHAMFKDRAVKFDPNSREGGLLKKLGFGGRIESLRLDCSN